MTDPEPRTPRLLSRAPRPSPAAFRTRGRRLALLLVCLVVAIVAPPHLPPFLLTVVMLSLVYSILAMSLDILMGYTGMESLGQAAFFGIGAYTVGIITTRHGMHSWPVAIVLAMVFGTIGAAIAGLMAVRLGGLFFLVMTLAFAQVLWGISESWDTLTGGYLGITGIPRPYRSLGSDVHFFYVVLAVFLLMSFLMLRLVRSPFGLSLRGVRDSESRMRTSGFNVWLHRYTIFVISGAFATVGGILYAFAIQFASPDVVSITTSFNAMLMVIIGGAGTLLGPVLGATGVVFLQNYISGYIPHWIILLGFIYIATVLFARKGLVGSARQWWAAWLRWRRRWVPEPEPAVDAERTSWNAMAISSRARADETEAIGESGSEGVALQLDAVSRSFGMIRAVENVSFEVHIGARMAILGPNGAGKTTLFNLISGVYKPSSGDIRLFGKSVARVPSYARVRMGLARTYQVTNLYPTLTVLDNMRLGLLGTKPTRYAMHSSVVRDTRLTERSKELLDVVGLWGLRDVEVRHLSYGHQRQIEIVMALASDPKVLLLDEPAAGLSIAETTPMIELIRSLDPKLTLLIIEHDMDVAFEVATEVTVLHNGQLLARGSRDEIKANSTVRDVYLGHALALEG